MLCPACNTENEDGADVCFHCGKSLYALVKGAVLAGRYEIQSLLGRGGMGLVYKAHDRELDETVAIKTLRSEVVASPQLAKRFRSEIKLARRISHRNVCRIHEFGREGHLSYIVMEVVDGTDVKRLLREQGRLPAEQAYGIAIAVAGALQAIHDVGVVHRDLKTPNIMLTRDGVVKLMDFGIAKRFEVDQASAATTTGHIVGTPEYMSPEQARAEPLDPRSDVYALGVVIFEIFTGSVPFRGDTPVATMLQQMQDPPPLEHPALPLGLKPVLAKALAKRREDRFASAGEMMEALRRARPQPDVRPADVPPVRKTSRTAGAAALAREEMETTPVPSLLPTEATMGPTSTPLLAPTVRPRRGRGGVWTAVAALVVSLVGVAMLLRPAPKPSIVAEESMPDPRSAEPTAVPPSAMSAATGRPSPARPLPPTAMSAVRKPTVAPTVPAAALPTAVAAATSEPAPAPTPTPPPPTPAPVPGSLRLTSKPTAEVTIDGRPAGKTPLQVPSLAAGRHVVVLTHPSYEPLRRVVDIKAGQPLELKVDLRDEALKRRDK